MAEITSGITFTASSNYSSYTGLDSGGAGMRDGVFGVNAGNNKNSVHGTNYGSGQYIQADLGSSKYVGTIKLAAINAAHPDGWGVSWLNSCDLQYSDDGTNWTTFVTISGVVDSAYKNFDVNSTHRYWRVTKASGFYVALSEFRFYDDVPSTFVPKVQWWT